MMGSKALVVCNLLAQCIALWNDTISELLPQVSQLNATKSLQVSPSLAAADR
jgi:hypothetical protein